MTTETIIAPPTKTIVWQGHERRRLLFWNVWRVVRRAWVLRALPLVDLVRLEEALSIEGQIGYLTRVTLIANAHGLRGTEAAPYETMAAIEAAHYEVSYPKRAAETAGPSAAGPSSAESPTPTATPSSTSPA